MTGCAGTGGLCSQADLALPSSLGGLGQVPKLAFPRLEEQDSKTHLNRED